MAEIRRCHASSAQGAAGDDVVVVALLQAERVVVVHQIGKLHVAVVWSVEEKHAVVLAVVPQELEAVVVLQVW